MFTNNNMQNNVFHNGNIQNHVILYLPRYAYIFFLYEELHKDTNFMHKKIFKFFLILCNIIETVIFLKLYSYSFT